MVTDSGSWPTLGLFAGTPAAFGDGNRSAIIKTRCRAAKWLSEAGFGEDVQADQVHHGGAERALCHYPADHLPYWQERFPDQAGAFVPGAFGENLSTRGLVEGDVGVGDVFRLGEALIQITQPRQPCWKVNQRFGIDGLSRLMVSTARSGWLCRVLEPGRVPPDAPLECVEPAEQVLALDRLWAIALDSAADPDELEAAAAHPALARPWCQRLRTRAEWLRKRRSPQ
jgi:MOSC domain-containing protein YiiM